MALTYCSSRDPIPALCDPQLELSDSLMGLIVDPLEAPACDMASLLKPVSTSHLNAQPKPAPVLSLNSTPLSTLPINSLHQDLYCTDAQNPDHVNANFAPNPELRDYQTCNSHFSTGSLINPVNSVYQEPGFPIGPCTGTMQGMVVPAVQSASAQSVAARIRRKKISEKTQELARLIPGGTRMTTAEMLQASFNYVKFLQAQIGILAMMDSKEAKEVPLIVEEHMRVLLDSTNMPRYLCAQGKCLVPKKLAMNLTKEMKSSVVVSRDLSRFLESISS